MDRTPSRLLELRCRRRPRSSSYRLGRGASSPASMKYDFTGYHRWYDPDGYPAVAPRIQRTTPLLRTYQRRFAKQLRL